ncbi:hypothetical protein M422DRAFT_33351 [Sphaerobolus stellatus SS14]|uniref:CENP-V/GFA domain-containing protein n=1 Tax=Sphaerobolus stellatus (strain SS14) TaxID=990650 RepID=A0A0C9VKW3_SPHS4|nr:hypothetical protein M422DRAFT_33351 [Sphaerobolus stellatus SS14]
MTEAKYRGGCLCGDVKIAIDVEPQLHALCHCTDCQQESGSANMPDVVFPPGSVKVVKGSTTLFDDEKPSGNHVRHYFCGRCGSSLWTSVDALGKVEAVKLGTFSGPDGTGTEFFKPTGELFVKSKQKWLPAVEGAQQWQGMPS